MGNNPIIFEDKNGEILQIGPWLVMLGLQSTVMDFFQGISNDLALRVTTSDQIEFVNPAAAQQVLTNILNSPAASQAQSAATLSKVALIQKILDTRTYAVAADNNVTSQTPLISGDGQRGYLVNQATFRYLNGLENSISAANQQGRPQDAIGNQRLYDNTQRNFNRAASDFIRSDDAANADPMLRNKFAVDRPVQAQTTVQQGRATPQERSAMRRDNRRQGRATRRNQGRARQQRRAIRGTVPIF
jgi:hypothetical protein